MYSIVMHLEDAIGNTPLFRIQRLGRAEAPHVEIHAKAEWFNPAGSVKDRPALFMLKSAMTEGKLKKGKTILDSTSGNTGIALAMLGASYGFPVTLCLPQNASPERKAILNAYGAELVLTDPLEGSDGAIKKAKEIFAKNREKYVYVDQYNNDANWKAHYETTAPEIWKQTEGRITHFVTGLGTSGTVMGVGRRLKEYNSNVRIVAMQPDSPFHGMEGLKHMETAIVPGIYDPKVADEQITVGTEEAQEWTQRLAKEEGMFVGVSSGANFAAALSVAKQIKTGVVVTIFCDSGDKYLSEQFWKSG
jgi:S-sulfo-L-cysteine synthase (O-acetyl-L-serine-dependent)